MRPVHGVRRHRPSRSDVSENRTHRSANFGESGSARFGRGRTPLLFFKHLSSYTHPCQPRGQRSGRGVFTCTAKFYNAVMNPVVIEPDILKRIRITTVWFIAVFVIGIGFIYLRDGLNSIVPVMYLAVGGIFLFAAALWLMYLRGGVVRRIELTENGIQVERRNGDINSLAWQDVTHYNYVVASGVCTWQLFTDDQKIGLGDYLFSADQWRQLSDRIGTALESVEAARLGRPRELSQSTLSWLGITCTLAAVTSGILTWRNGWGVNGVVVTTFLLLVAGFTFKKSMSLWRSRVIGIPVITILVLGPIIFGAYMWVQEKQFERDQQRRQVELERLIEESDRVSEQSQQTMRDITRQQIERSRKRSERLRDEGRIEEANELDRQTRQLEQEMIEREKSWTNDRSQR